MQQSLLRIVLVVPLVGTWIEMVHFQSLNNRILSFPLWERGLKYELSTDMYCPVTVVPLVGTWIEMVHFQSLNNRILSFPLWERGVKYGK